MTPCPASPLPDMERVRGRWPQPTPSAEERMRLYVDRRQMVPETEEQLNRKKARGHAVLTDLTATFRRVPRHRALVPIN